MANGVATTNLDVDSTLDELLGNRNGNSVRIPLNVFSNQLRTEISTTVDARSFGVIPDGVVTVDENTGEVSITGTDNTAAIQALIDHCETANVRGYIPTGVYVCGVLSFTDTGHSLIQGEINGTDNGGLWQENYSGTTLVNPKGQILKGGYYGNPWPTRHMMFKNITLVGNTCSDELIVAITGDGSGAEVYPTVENGEIIGCQVVNGGSDYTWANVTFIGGGGAGAAGTVSLSSGGVTNVIMTDVGSDYESDIAVVDLQGVTSGSQFENVSIANLGYGSGLSCKGAWFVDFLGLTVTSAAGHKRGSDGETHAWAAGSNGIKIYHESEIDGGPLLVRARSVKYFQHNLVIGSIDYDTNDKWTQAITIDGGYFQRGLIGVACRTNAWQIILDNVHMEKNIVSLVTGCNARQVIMRGGAMQNTAEEGQPQAHVGYRMTQSDAYNQRATRGFLMTGVSVGETTGIEPVVVDNSSGNIFGVDISHNIFRVTDESVTRLVKWIGSEPQGTYVRNFLTGDSHAGVTSTVGTGAAALRSVDHMVDLDGKVYGGHVFDSNYTGQLLRMQSGKSSLEYNFWVDGIGTLRFKGGTPETGTDGYPILSMKVGDTASRPGAGFKFAGQVYGDTDLDRNISVCPLTFDWLDPGRYVGEKLPTGPSQPGKPGEWCTIEAPSGTDYLVVCTQANTWKHVELSSGTAPWS